MDNLGQAYTVINITNSDLYKISTRKYLKVIDFRQKLNN